jgi:diphosphomevalonate decarboxylase
MKKVEVVNAILKDRFNYLPDEPGKAFASTNIALCKYWGKRDQELNLPITGSFSISMGNYGTTTQIGISDSDNDVVIFNDDYIDPNTSFYKRLIAFFDLFRQKKQWFFHFKSDANIPTAAGLASSASGFASTVKALNLLFQWELSEKELSILARLGSGSACRSISSGFVEWYAGVNEDGMDSYAKVFPDVWSDICIGIMMISSKEKHLSSREAMQRTVTTTPLYKAWPTKVNEDLREIKQAIRIKDFSLFGKIAESDAMSMHATMLSSWPPIFYTLPETLIIMRKIWEVREQGLPLYFTQDAGPNLKLLFLEKDSETIQTLFPEIKIIQPFK